MWGVTKAAVNIGYGDITKHQGVHPERTFDPPYGYKPPAWGVEPKNFDMLGVGTVNNAALKGSGCDCGKSYSSAALSGGRSYTNAALKGGRSYTNAALKGGRSYTNAALKGGRSYTNAALKGGRSYTNAALKGGRSYTNAALKGGKKYDKGLANLLRWQKLNNPKAYQNTISALQNPSSKLN